MYILMLIFAHDINDRQSTSGGAMFLFNNLVGWASKKQSLVTISTTEAEYVALSHFSGFIELMRNIFVELKVINKIPVNVFEDNRSVLLMIKNGTNRKVKHLDVKFHKIRDLVEKRVIVLSYVRSSEQIADLFTKPLKVNLFKHFFLLYLMFLEFVPCYNCNDRLLLF